MSSLKSAAEPVPGRRSGRLGAVDLARGAAVVAMAIYHTGWDLGELRLTTIDLRDLRAWELFARVIATSFLLLVGAGLVLAHGRTLGPRAFLRRLAIVSAAAAAVSVVSYAVFPSSWIFFGILHCIALSSVLALPFLRLPVWVTVAAGIAVVALPFLVAIPLFDAPLLAFVGLGARLPVTNDYVPLFPWFGIVLLGIAAMRLGRPLLDRLPERTGAYPGPLRALAFAGRHSLVIYLVHQPLIFGALAGYAAVIGRSPAAEAAWFGRAWDRSCATSGWPAETCGKARDCAIDTYRREGIWPRLMADEATEDDRARMPGLVRSCFPPARPRAEPGSD